MPYLTTHKTGDTYDGAEFHMQLNGDPMDLTGVVIAMDVRRVHESSPALSLDTDAGLTITDAAGGVFEIDAFLVTLEPGTYEYDIQFTFPSGRVKTYVAGNWEITQDVTT